jgi:hypothetical protein
MTVFYYVVWKAEKRAFYRVRIKLIGKETNRGGEQL